MLLRTIFAAVLVALSTIPGLASAEKSAPAPGEDGKTHVSHTRLTPVLMHRAVPPYWGVHTYERPSGRRGK